MWKLIIEDDEGKRIVVPLTRDDYTIGRKEGNTIRLTERNVSRAHAQLRRSGGPPALSIAGNPGAYVLEDLSSYNGVFINGSRVAQPQALAHGDLVQIGDYRIVLQDDTAVAEPVTEIIGDDAHSTLPNPAQGGSVPSFFERPNRLVMLAGPNPGAEYPLDRERMTIGRAEDASISVNHNSVSRLHCEVHALGDSRFEIVDKGSSNGVRLNGADLRRGIIEAGDVVELGDVRFKFVGAGQIFLPTISESDGQDLETLVTREMGRGKGRIPSFVPYLLLGALVAVVGIGAWAFSREKGNAATLTNASASALAASELAALYEAKGLCESGHCEAAHDKLMLRISPTSALLRSPDFRDIENHWADILLARAETLDDVAARRSLLNQVAQAQTVDPTRRKAAADKLQALDSVQTANPEQLPPATTISTSELLAPDRKQPEANTRKPIASNSTSAAAHPSSKPSTSSSNANVADQARSIMLNDPSGARALLERRVLSGHGTREEIGLLKTICKSQHDQTCVSTCNQLLGQ